MRIIGVMRISDAFAEFCSETIDRLAEFCDGTCFVTNNVTKAEVLAAMSNCPNLLSTKETCSPWSHYTSIRDAYELGCSHHADWVVIPDHDEILPYDQLRVEIEKAEALHKMVIQFPFVNCWGSPLTIVAPSLNITGDHGKVFKAGIQEFKEAGYCIPEGYWDSILLCPYPLRHCSNMTELFRNRRLEERGSVQPWAVDEPKTLPYISGWTMEDFRREEESRYHDGSAIREISKEKQQE